MGKGGQIWWNYNPPAVPVFPGNVLWRFQIDGPQWSEIAKATPCDVHKEEEESHLYTKENCPTGYAWLGSPSLPPFYCSESIEMKNPAVCYRFNFGESSFRHKALCIPRNLHFKEEESHEYRRKDSDYHSRLHQNPPPGPILPCPEEVEDTRNYDCCRQLPIKHPLPCKPPLPPLPEACNTPYKNYLGEREWHTTDRTKCCWDGSRATDSETLQYERNIRSANPKNIPPVCWCRKLKLPCTSICPNEMEKFTPESPPSMDDLPPYYRYAEDKGECNKRETYGPGPYCDYGFVPWQPLTNPHFVPCNYYFNEQRTNCRKKVNCRPGCPAPTPEEAPPRGAVPPEPRYCPQVAPPKPPPSFASSTPTEPPVCRASPPIPECGNRRLPYRRLPWSGPSYSRNLGPKPPTSPHPTPPPVPYTGCPGRPPAYPRHTDICGRIRGGCNEDEDQLNDSPVPPNVVEAGQSE